MSKFKNIFVAVIILTLSISAFGQESQGKNYYKVIFPEIDQFQLKEVLPACMDIFNSIGENKAEPNILYFRTDKEVTAEFLRKELDKKGFDFKVELKLIEDER
ncbi:MAG: hypothetical protein WC994_06105 [Brumimicrobium sp.]